MSYFSEASDGCNAIFNSSDGLISSRGYPWQYPNNQFCNTTVIVSRGQVVRFTIEDIYLQVTDMCTADSVRVSYREKSIEIMSTFIFKSQPWTQLHVFYVLCWEVDSSEWKSLHTDCARLNFIIASQTRLEQFQLLM